MHKYKNIGRTICCLLLTLLLYANIIFANEIEYLKLSDDELPSIVIAYSLISSRYNDFNCIFNVKHNVVALIANEFDKLPGGISTKLSFVRSSFILQNSIGQFAGFLRTNDQTLESAKIPYKSFLYVTTPIDSFDNRILVIISSVSPEQTTIFSIDNQLKTVMLYDSIVKNNIDNMKDIKGSRLLGSIYCVKVIKPGLFELQERLEPGARGFVSPYKYRRFYIDITKGKFKLLAGIT
jgi:hypothetical protein